MELESAPSLPMPSPFPGMNPYLEHPDRWSTVHNRLIVALADLLTSQLLPKYQVDIEKRVYEVVGTNSLLVGRPDVTVQRSRSGDPALATNVAVSVPAQPVQVALPMLEEVREAFLEIKEAATQLVVTTIEILSPTNKRGDGRQKYEQKRQQVLGSQTHLIEIDLLREGELLAMTGVPTASDYRILVSRAQQRPLADLYPFDLSDAIPPFPVPLQAEDPEPVVELQALLNEVYQRSGYDYFIDYRTDPSPPLSGASRVWVDTLLKQQGLR
jgi:hypothetical protein